LVDQNLIEFEKLESRGTGPSNGAGSAMYYRGFPLTVGSPQSKVLTQKRQELFVSSMGENGANELKFFNLTGDSREHQCV